MPITRRFIDWQQPALAAVVSELVLQNQTLGFCDLSDFIVVFPGQRARRRFLELLAGRTQNRNIPPDTITVGDLPERLYRPQKPFADTLTQRMAWKHAFQHLPSELVRQVIPYPPEEDRVDAWLHLSEMLAHLHRELAADQLRFDDVLKVAGSQLDENEQARWRSLSAIQEEYLRILDGLNLWDMQTARLVAIEKLECQSRKNIVLVGSVDMTRTLRQMLDQVAEQVTVYIHAPVSLKDAFDRHGCLNVGDWTGRSIDLAPDQLILVNSPVDQARAIGQSLASQSGKWRVDEITIGIADDELVPSVQRILGNQGVSTRWFTGHPFHQTPLYHLLTCVIEFLLNDQTKPFTTLVRHPDISSWLTTQGANPLWQIFLDKYVSEHLPASLGPWLGSPEHYEPVSQVYELITESLAELREDSREAGQWHAPVTRWMLQLYSHKEFDPDLPEDQLLLEAFERFQRVMQSLNELPESLAPIVSAAQALRLAVEQLEQEMIPAPQNPDAVELLGWLELPLDDAPELVVVGFNEGNVPSSLNADLFLPNSLRRDLRMTDNSRRLARDVYALSAILHSRRSVRLIAGRTTARGDALRPSRLWFATDPLTIAQRIQRFYGDNTENETTPTTPVPEEHESNEPATNVSAIQADGQVYDTWDSSWNEPEPFHRPPTRLIVPRPESERDFEGPIPVTGFSAYLASPYRFYLRHVLKLRTLDDDVDELDARDFGNLLHRVLKGFGRSEWRNSRDGTKIASYLNHQLDQSADLLYGGDPLFPVQIQIEQARDRLQAFAQWQARRALEGWEIIDTEKACETSLRLDDGRTVMIHGQIDRIDRHRESDTWAILDYKTGEQRRSPRQVHQSRGEWIDLQLPLYRLLAMPYGIGGRVTMGYISIPRDNDRLECLLADWSDEELLTAEAVARKTAAHILDRDFWVELDRPTSMLSEFGPICQDGVLDREVIV